MVERPTTSSSTTRLSIMRVFQPIKLYYDYSIALYSVRMDNCQTICEIAFFTNYR